MRCGLTLYRHGNGGAFTRSFRELFLLLAFLTTLAGCGSQAQLLVESLDGAESQLEGSKYPYFVTEPQLSGPIDISGDRRQAITPPFPSRLSFTLEIPQAAFLQFSTALIMERQVWRGRAEYLVEIEAGGEQTVVYSETFGSNLANRWHDREIDLTRWSGSTVVLSLEAHSPRRREVPWADRIQTAWGEPVLVSSRSKLAAAEARASASTLADWLQAGADGAGITPQDQNMFLRLAINMFLGGFLAICIRELFKRYGVTRSNRESFANLFPLFTLVTIMVIFVVQTSVALSLGLIGALSIVRFRSAIKSPEELSYLLFCVAIGLTLGANQKLLAVMAVLLISTYVVVRPSLDFPTNRRRLLLTVSGDAGKFYGASAIDVVRTTTKELTIQRLDHVGDHAELRAIVAVNNDEEANRLMSSLRAKLPHLQVSYLDADSLY